MRSRSIFISVVKTSFLIIIFCCGCFHSNRQTKEEIKFYHRDMGGINDYDTYFDNFKITNYTNKSVLATDLFSFAKKYIDTVHADRPVSHVFFTGEKPSQNLPKPSEDYFDKGRKQALLWFTFSNNFPQNKGKKTVELSHLTVWRNKDSKSYDYGVPSQKRIIDSILTSKEPFDNDF